MLYLQQAEGLSVTSCLFVFIAEGPYTVYVDTQVFVALSIGLLRTFYKSASIHCAVNTFREYK